jgi:hypothetical protein
MTDPDKKKIPRTLENAEKSTQFVDKEGNIVDADQAYFNAILASSGALVSIAEALNDMAADIEDMKTIMVKKAVQDKIITPVEAEEMSNDEDEDEPTGK